MMRIIIHDFGAYAFPFQLSKTLSLLGYKVLHLYASHVPLKGNVQVNFNILNEGSLEIIKVDIGEKYHKYNFLKRWKQDRKYGKLLTKYVEKFDANIIFNSNSPIETSNILQKHCQKMDIPYIHWTQDIHTLAIQTVFQKKYPLLAPFIISYYKKIEGRIINKSDAVIVISENFISEFNNNGFHNSNLRVIPNWMPLDEMVSTKKSNSWSIKNELDKTFNIIYMGTLSYKHNEDLFLDLSKNFITQENVRIVVISEGIIFDKLSFHKDNNPNVFSNLVLLGWQKYEDISMILGSGDIMLAMITKDASNFSVPCKVLTYLSASKPVIASIPDGNLIAKMLQEENIGFAFPPHEIDLLIEKINLLISDDELRDAISHRGREYALNAFDIKKISKQFIDIINLVTR